MRTAHLGIGCHEATIRYCIWRLQARQESGKYRQSNIHVHTYIYAHEAYGNLLRVATIYSYYSEWLIIHSGCLAERIPECQLDTEQIFIMRIDDIMYIQMATDN